MRINGAYEVRQPAVSLLETRPVGHLGYQAHQRPVRPVARHAVPKQVPFYQVFVGQHPALLLEPVVHQLRQISFPDHHAVHDKGAAAGTRVVYGPFGHLRDAPATAGEGTSDGPGVPAGTALPQATVKPMVIVPSSARSRRSELIISFRCSAGANQYIRVAVAEGLDVIFTSMNVRGDARRDVGGGFERIQQDLWR